jgi:hypothetical protein
VNEPDLFAALRDEGIDADDHEIRAAVRAVLRHVDDVHRRRGTHEARRCMEAMHEALALRLRHPDVADMSSFEASYDEDA